MRIEISKGTIVETAILLVPVLGAGVGVATGRLDSGAAAVLAAVAEGTVTVPAVIWGPGSVGEADFDGVIRKFRRQ